MNSVFLILVTCVLPFVFALILTPLVRSIAIRIGALDLPNHRKVHTLPIPRLGGVSVLLASIFTVCTLHLLQDTEWSIGKFKFESWQPMLIGGAIVFALGIYDDIRPLRMRTKFFFQTIAVGITMWSGVVIQKMSLWDMTGTELGFLALPVTFIWLMGVMNAFNLVDGLDGLAAGLASISAGTCAAIFLFRGNVDEAVLLLILLGALLGFLWFNFNPATIFLGDSGSLLVGFLLASTAVLGSQKGATALAIVIPLLAFGLPILDTLLSMIRRLAKSLKHTSNLGIVDKIRCVPGMFSADQRHIHHRLVQLGLSHRRAVLLLYSLALGLAFLALFAVMGKNQNIGVTLIIVGLATYIGIRKLGYDEISFLKAKDLLAFYKQSGFSRYFFVGFVDLVLIAASYWITFFLKFDLMHENISNTWYALVFPWVVLIQLVVFYVVGQYKGVWRTSGIADLIRGALAVGGGTALSFVLSRALYPPPETFTFFCINFLVLGSLVLCARSSYKVLEYFGQRERTSQTCAMIYGAGQGGQLVARELLQNNQYELKILGYIDDNPILHGRFINQLPVFGGVNDLTKIIGEQEASAIIISTDKIPVSSLKKVELVCKQLSIRFIGARFELIDLSVQPGHNSGTNNYQESLAVRPVKSMESV